MPATTPATTPAAAPATTPTAAPTAAPSGGPPRPLTARRQATRQRVLDAASEVFAERGFHGASVEDICERAGFTRGAFYSNFGSKDDLVIELSTQQVSRIVGRIEMAAALDASPNEVLAAAFAAISDEPSRHERWLLLNTEFTLHAIRDADARRAWAAQQRNIRAALIEVVDAAITEHGIDLPMSTELFVRSAMALSQGSTTQHLIEPRAIAQGELERTVLPILLGLDGAPRRQD